MHENIKLKLKIHFIAVWLPYKEMYIFSMCRLMHLEVKSPGRPDFLNKEEVLGSFKQRGHVMHSPQHLGKSALVAMEIAN